MTPITSLRLAEHLGVRHSTVLRVINRQRAFLSESAFTHRYVPINYCKNGRTRRLYRIGAEGYRGVLLHWAPSRDTPRVVAAQIELIHEFNDVERKFNARFSP